MVQHRELSFKNWNVKTNLILTLNTEQDSIFGIEMTGVTGEHINWCGGGAEVNFYCTTSLWGDEGSGVAQWYLKKQTCFLTIKS